MAKDEGGGEGLKGHSVADITRALKGITFPATKADLAERAKGDEEVSGLVEAMPDDGEYGTIAEVMHAMKAAN